MTPDATADLEDASLRIAALEAENERLRDAATSAAGSRGRQRWRAWVSAVCIVVATILVPASIVTAWARVQLVDEDSFVATIAPLASDPAVQGMIVDQTMDAITAQVDFAQLTSSAIDGIATLGLPPAAVSALTLLKQPAADGLESLVDRAVTRVVTSDSFAGVWATATRAAHRALTTTATSDGGGLVVRTDDGVGIQLGAIVERVKQNLADQGVGIASLIPRIDRVVILGDGQNLALIRMSYAIATAVGYWLPLLALGLFLIGIVVARRRSTALRGSGVGLLVGGGSLAVGIATGAALMSTVATQTGLDATALGVIYAQASAGAAHTATVIAVIGAVVIALAWVNGRSRGALAVRTGVGSINSGLRRALASRGVDTGSFGRWMYAQRTLVRAALVVLSIVWLLALRPLTVGDIVLVLVVSLLVWWLAELVQRRDDESVAVADDADAQRAEAATDAEALPAAPATSESPQESHGAPAAKR